ncbi:MAG: AbrB/MazE/SpoVT family DNA-binding domain-containing protein [Thermoplasmatales archaeon]|nr:AbrB/MazE/SpoVT family DNA-binding domain-containing protein [Thermoplasmatales archaeon]
MFKGIKFYGSVKVGERGQIALPVELRKKQGIKPGDKILVLGREEKDAAGVFLMKADMLSKMMERFKDFGRMMREVKK